MVHLALVEGFLDVALALIDFGGGTPKVNIQGSGFSFFNPSLLGQQPHFTYLILCVALKNYDGVKQLVERNAQLNELAPAVLSWNTAIREERDYYEVPPLALACILGYEVMYDFLIDCGAEDEFISSDKTHLFFWIFGWKH